MRSERGLIEMTYSPQSLLDLRAYLQPRTGLAPIALGIQHYSPDSGGYHEGWDLLRQGYGYDDYSVCESTRDAHATDAASAIDIGDFTAGGTTAGGTTLRALTLWLVDQCAAAAPDTQDIREIIYTPDGAVVRRWDRQGVRSSGDDSHLYHTHISYFRDSEGRDKVGLFRRFFEGDTDMDTEQARMLYNLDRLNTALLLGHDTVTQILGDDGNYHDYPLQLVKDVNTLKAVRTTGVDLDALAEKIDAMVKARVAEVTGTTGQPL